MDKLINLNSNGQDPYRFSCKTNNLKIEPKSSIALVSGKLHKANEIIIDDSNNTLTCAFGQHAFDTDGNDFQMPFLGHFDIKLRHGTYNLVGMPVGSADSETGMPVNSILGEVVRELNNKNPWLMWGFKGEYEESASDNTTATITPFIKGLITSNIPNDMDEAKYLKGGSAGDLAISHRAGTALSEFIPQFDDDDGDNTTEDNFVIQTDDFVSHIFESYDVGTATINVHPILEFVLPSISGKDNFFGATVGLATQEQIKNAAGKASGGPMTWYSYRKPAGEDHKVIVGNGFLFFNVEPSGKIFAIVSDINEDGETRSRGNKFKSEFTQQYEDDKEIALKVFGELEQDVYRITFTVENVTDSTSESVTYDDDNGFRTAANDKTFLFKGVAAYKGKKNDGSDFDAADAPAVFFQDESRFSDDFDDRRGRISSLGSTPNYDDVNTGRLKIYLFYQQLQDNTPIFTHEDGTVDQFMHLTDNITTKCNANWLAPDFTTSSDNQPNDYYYIGETFNSGTLSIKPNSSLDITDYCIKIRNLNISSMTGSPEECQKDTTIHTHYSDTFEDKIIVIEPPNINYIALKNTNSVIVSNLDIEISTPENEPAKNLKGTTYLTIAIKSNTLENRIDKLLNKMKQKEMRSETVDNREKTIALNNTI